MAFDFCIAALNHGSTNYATQVDERQSTISTMVATVWDRMESVMGVKPLTVVAVRDSLKISYQAAVKLKNGGGLSSDNLLKFSKKYGLNPHWVATGAGEKYAAANGVTPPPPPTADNGPFNAITADEAAFLEDIRWLLDSDRERYRKEIAAKAKELREHMGKVMSGIQTPPTTTGKK